jgi:hypothetical protein
MLNYGKELVGPQTAGKALGLADNVIRMAAVVAEDERPDLLREAFELRALALKGLGRRPEAARSPERAVREARLAARSGEYAKAWLPMAIMNLANRYSELGDHSANWWTICPGSRGCPFGRPGPGSHPDSRTS